LKVETDKSLYRIALTQIKGVGAVYARNLLEAVGDEETIFKEDARKLEAIPRISRRLIKEIRDPDVLKNAEKELKFAVKNDLRILFITDDDYPRQLAPCADAPLLLYSKGNAGFNNFKTVSVVGTRSATKYGENACMEFIEKLSAVPNVQIVSGLAYGIDICAHRAALKNNLSTVAILAHGLDRIYPQIHRQTAVEMLQNGALLTEFPSGTAPDKHNFLKRNRIVACMADVVVVIESGEKGGSLITADIANTYGREVFALPGRIYDKMSAGCNRLVFDNKAVILQSVDNFISHMGWGEEREKQEKKPIPKQKELFPDQLSEREAAIVEKLTNNGPTHMDTLVVELGLSVPNLLEATLELELKGIIESRPGGMFRLV
jgi:DNA processing protein